MTAPASSPFGGTNLPLGSTTIGDRLRIGFITHLDHSEDPRFVYRDTIRLIQELEELGYDSAWIATRHFHSGWAALPSPYGFLGALAAATSTIGLGTAVLPIILDDPVRAAEEVAAIDHLAGGRLLLGLGKGVPSDSYHVFHTWTNDRDTSFENQIDRLHWALQGGVVEGGTGAIWPQNPALEGRLFHGSSNIDTIRFAGRTGDGFILERFGNGPERHPDARAAFQRRQADSVREYRRVFADTWGSTRTPWVVTSRSAFPGRTTEEALALAGERTARWNVASAAAGRVDLSLSIPDQLLSDNFAWGSPEALAADLLADPTIALTDELVLGIHPAVLDRAETIDRARVLLREVVPRVEEGWRAQRASALAEVNARADTLQGS
ncbi:LLM class flavin-dependent oxidoreductase [Microbacterium oxydans]|uniref:LLM class flavin-dependent oxidoreductase n=1 Tax=Microbacterium oxydans TaxID=82380 RepID=UPI0036725CD1